ncbi:RNA-binding CRS1 / YhbY (CRM) domain protein [Quillaja saponaria]|uniref:RNA-binding CRS1 / YhbY (CRM) domain protein n=1 Tax=Quillaja saponaria TaxID=32244 RepID=A0AAD7VIC0_QUISA|nr:RNA-binding CRS1 / YhbY (CRM) domain protein [Quillaja saponaria]
MVGRVLASVSLRKYHPLKNLFSNSILLTSFLPKTLLPTRFFCQEPIFRCHFDIKRSPFLGYQWIHSGRLLKSSDKVIEPLKESEKCSTVNSTADSKVKRKKLKGKRAVVRWLKFFRWKKKKEYKRLTAEEKILYKLRKVKKKEGRLAEALKKIEPSESSETTHDPEILTPEEHFFFLKMGLKCKNYVPVGRRGIYQGVILNMHLHWKKHQTLQVVVKTFSPEEVKEIAAELAKLTGGIVLDIHEDNTIIMYRGKNYSQPPTEIMSPRVTLSRKKALDKSKYRDGLRAVKKDIPRLEQELELLQAQLKRKSESKTTNVFEEVRESENIEPGSISNFQLENSDKLKNVMDRSEDDAEMDSADMPSDSEDLSDIFSTDSDAENEAKVERPLYLDKFEKFPVERDGELDDFEEHLRQLSQNSTNSKSLEDDIDSSKFDEVDQIFLRAASLLKKRRR